MYLCDEAIHVHDNCVVYTVVNEVPLLPPSLSTSADTISPTATVTDATVSQDTMGSSVESSSSNATLVTTTVIIATTATSHLPYSADSTTPTSTPTDSGLIFYTGEVAIWVLQDYLFFRS